MSSERHDTPKTRRYEVPAVILVDAADETEAHDKALELGATLDQESGPGAFFFGVGVAATDLPKESAEDRQGESLSEHGDSLQSAAGVS